METRQIPNSTEDIFNFLIITVSKEESIIADFLEDPFDYAQVLD